MTNITDHYSLEKVKALRAYFLRLRNSSRGKPDHADLETTLKLCEQLIAAMTRADATPAKGGNA